MLEIDALSLQIQEPEDHGEFIEVIFNLPLKKYFLFYTTYQMRYLRVLVRSKSKILNI